MDRCISMRMRVCVRVSAGLEKDSDDGGEVDGEGVRRGWGGDGAVNGFEEAGAV